jgi:hypothetical protein
MRRTAAILLVAFAVLATATRRRAVTPQPSTDESNTFVFDSGFRAVNATNPAAGVAPNGDVYLYYTDHSTNRQMRTTAADGLAFGTAVVTTTFQYDSRNTLMPDGKTWRRYQLNQQTATMTSVKSSDGITFTPESGTRYTAQPQDHGWIGVYDAFSDRSGGVVLLYLGDMLGLNNTRRAYSRDGGATFTFDHGNVLGDDNAGGGPQSYVDEKTIRLPDGRIRLFTMKQNELHQTTIYSFLSIDDGATFALETGARLLFTDFKDDTLRSLNDPVCVRLSDGRYRIYVASLRSDNVWVIVSATSKS